MGEIRRERKTHNDKVTQYSFAPNGYIAPCPYMDECINHPIGCGGGTWWCGRRWHKGKCERSESIE